MHLIKRVYKCDYFVGATFFKHLRSIGKLVEVIKVPTSFILTGKMLQHNHKIFGREQHLLLDDVHLEVDPERVVSYAVPVEKSCSFHEIGLVLEQD
jgi:hypothetical protein